MPQIFSGIGKIFTGSSPSVWGEQIPGGLGRTLPGQQIPGATSIPNWQQAANIGLAGMGTLGNWLQQRRYQGFQDQYMNLMRQYANLTPQQVMSGILAMKQPLSLALRQSVGNSVQGDLAARGLATAPGIYGSVLSQSLAPYDQQLLQQATEAFFRMKGLPIQAGGALPWGMSQRPEPADLGGLIYRILQARNAQPAFPGLAPGFISGGFGGPTSVPTLPSTLPDQWLVGNIGGT